MYHDSREESELEMKKRDLPHVSQTERGVQASALKFIFQTPTLIYRFHSAVLKAEAGLYAWCLRAAHLCLSTAVSKPWFHQEDGLQSRFPQVLLCFKTVVHV